MKQKQKVNVVIYQTLLLWLSGYQVVTVSFWDSEEIVYKFASVPFYKICYPFFCQLYSIDCLFIFNFSALNVKFAVFSISSAAHQNSSAIFWVYNVSDTIHCLSKLLYALIIAADLSGDTKHISIKFAEESYYLLKLLFILTAPTRAL